MLNKEEFDFLGISKFHEAGYKGQGVTICSKENIIENIFDDVFCMEYEEPSKWSKHGTNVMDYIRQVAPEATKWAIETQGTIKSGVLQSEGMDYLQKNVPDILTTSYFKSSDTKEPKISLYKQLHDKGCFLVCAAGNDGEEGINKIANGDIWKAIGACRYSKGNVKRETYSSIGEELDFMSFDNLKATQGERKARRHVIFCTSFCRYARPRSMLLHSKNRKKTHTRTT